MTTIKFRRDTSANWTSVNPIPAQGEPCYETDTGKLKIGNGSDNYVTLPYVSDGGGSSGNLPIATATTLGGVKIGNNLSITEDGTLSATGGSAPDNMVTTDTTQTISGDKTFTRGITTTDIYPAGEITFDSTSQYRHINNIDSIAGGYRTQNGYITFKGDTTLVGDDKLVLDGRTGGLKLTAASSANITCENDLITPNIRTTANGTIKLEHPMNNASGLITISNSYGQLSISSSLGGNNNLLEVIRGTAYALIDGDNIETKDKDGNIHTYINSRNIDTTYMKWDTNTGKLKVDTEAVAGLAMPSNKYIDLTLGASGATYTAPANGWFFLRKLTSEGNQFIGLYQTEGDGVTSEVTDSLANHDSSIFIPVRKGQVVTCYYTFGGETIEFRFVYAKGSEPTV